MIESEIMKKILVALCKEYPQGLFYRRNTGAMKTSDGFVKFGMPGMADIGGIINGHCIEIEVKSLTGSQTEHQKKWQIAVAKAGGTYILTTSVNDCLDKLRNIPYQDNHAQGYE